MRVYLVVMDETAEAGKAMRFASRKAAASGDCVHILALVPKQAFTAFSVIQDTIEHEARDRAEVMACTAAGSLFSDSGKMPTISVQMGDGIVVVREYLERHPEIVALVLGAAGGGTPGPLITHFAAHADSLPCPLIIVPGHFTDDEIDALA